MLLLRGKLYYTKRLRVLSISPYLSTWCMTGGNMWALPPFPGCGGARLPSPLVGGVYWTFDLKYPWMIWFDENGVISIGFEGVLWSGLIFRFFFFVLCLFFVQWVSCSLIDLCHSSCLLYTLFRTELLIDSRPAFLPSRLVTVWLFSLFSAGKTFSTTGWKIGWAIGPQHLVRCIGNTPEGL